MAADRDDDEPLGYGKPPKWAQFVKGQSGNPRGRPRKVKAEPPAPLDSAHFNILRAELDRKVRIKEGDETKQLTMREIIFKALATSAAKGNVHAARDILRADRELEAHDAEAQRVASEQAKRNAATERQVLDHIVSWRDERRAVWDAAALQGREPDQPWPHPDDILIDHDAGHWRPRGPWQDSDVPFYRYIRAERDYHFARAALARRSRDKGTRLLARCRDWCWVNFDVLLPLRWQVSSSAEPLMRFMLVRPIADLRADLRIYAERVAAFRPASMGGANSRDEYRFANIVMRPVLKTMGYRSLAEFERDYIDHGGAPSVRRAIG